MYWLPPTPLEGSTEKAEMTSELFSLVARKQAPTLGCKEYAPVLITLLHIVKQSL